MIIIYILSVLAVVIILAALIFKVAGFRFRNKYKNEVNDSFGQDSLIRKPILTDEDIRHLPLPVQNYIVTSGSLGKPKVSNFKLEFNGQIRKNEQTPWMPFVSEQYNFLKIPTRLFFMKARMMNLPVPGFHCFKNGEAYMDIRLLGLFRVQFQSGTEMGIAETVTFFNDMCCMAPGTLIDERILWQETDGQTVKAVFTNNGITISAMLYFNEQGELVNFISDDRYVYSGKDIMKQLRWSTPLKDYREINGYRLASSAEAIYHYPEGNLCYGTFSLQRVTYNCTGFN